MISGRHPLGSSNCPRSIFSPSGTVGQCESEYCEAVVKMERDMLAGLISELKWRIRIFVYLVEFQKRAYFNKVAMMKSGITCLDYVPKIL